MTLDVVCNNGEYANGSIMVAGEGPQGLTVNGSPINYNSIQTTIGTDGRFGSGGQLSSGATEDVGFLVEDGGGNHAAHGIALQPATGRLLLINPPGIDGGLKG